jgi:hypothetical protein
MYLGITLCLQSLDVWDLTLPVGIAFVATLCAIAAAWITYRPMVAGALFAVTAIAAAAGLLRLVISNRRE